jgi:subtilase family serine protease
MSAKTRTARDYRPSFDRCDDRILLSASPLVPAQIRQAYGENINFNVNGRSYTATGAGQTIAIVIGGLDPYISNDLATFDRTYGISAPPSFRSVTFQGAQNNESASSIMETSLDVEWAHAVAPGANILLVQAASMNTSDLMTAVNWARSQPGVSVVSMSWGSPESSADHQYDSIFTTPAGHTGVTFVASSGDSGFFGSRQGPPVSVEWPAAVPTVLSVGGTTLSVASNGSYLGETAWNYSYSPSQGWSGGGGGVSHVYAEPSYQYGVQRTGGRTVPDVAYDAATGVSIYDSLAGGWTSVGGTSAGAPQWAGLIAEVNQGRALAGLKPLDGASQTLPGIYAFSSAFRDITSRTNGYAAGPGYDLATGLGSPIAYQLAGDLAFHITSNYGLAASNAMVATQSLPTDSQSSATMTPLLSVPGSSVPLRSGMDEAIHTDTTDSSVREPLLVGLVPTSPAQSIEHRHDHLDRALGSLMDDDLALLRS